MMILSIIMGFLKKTTHKSTIMGETIIEIIANTTNESYDNRHIYGITLIL